MKDVLFSASLGDYYRCGSIYSRPNAFYIAHKHVYYMAICMQFTVLRGCCGFVVRICRPAQMARKVSLSVDPTN